MPVTVQKNTVVPAKYSGLLTPQFIKRARARLYEEKLYDFVQGAWHILEPAAPFVGGWHLEAICEHLEACTNGQIRKLIINIPPRCMKGCEDSTQVLTPSGFRKHGEL